MEESEKIKYVINELKGIMKRVRGLERKVKWKKIKQMKN